MAEIIDFEIPDFLKGHSAKEIQERILANITDKMDKSEGGVLWDITFPSALVIAETVEYVCVEMLRNLFPMWAEGKILDYHGENRGLTRKPAVKAVGTVKFTGKDGTKIARGTRVATTAMDASETIVIFETVEAVVIDGGVAVAGVRAIIAGVDGNVAAGRIDRLDILDENISTVTNEESAYGGLDEEEDDDYRQRIIDADEAQGISFSGCVADYKRWAMSVNGVGNAVIDTPEDGSGLVTIVITDTDGKAASEKVCQDVYNYIMRPDAPAERLAPINAVLSVISPSMTTISVRANVVLDGSVMMSGVIDNFMKLLNAYYQEACNDGYIRYNKVSAILTGIAGVEDFSGLLVNGGMANIAVTSDELPVTYAENIVFVEA